MSRNEHTQKAEIFPCFFVDIVATAAGSLHTLGLKADGTVVAVGSNNHGQCGVSDWTDIRIPQERVPFR